MHIFIYIKVDTQRLLEKIEEREREYEHIGSDMWMGELDSRFFYLSPNTTFQRQWNSCSTNSMLMFYSDDVHVAQSSSSRSTNETMYLRRKNVHIRIKWSQVILYAFRGYFFRVPRGTWRLAICAIQPNKLHKRKRAHGEKGSWFYGNASGIFSTDAYS